MGVTLIFQSLKLSKLYLSLGGQSFFSSVEMSVFEIFYSFAARTFKSVEYFQEIHQKQQQATNKNCSFHINIYCISVSFRFAKNLDPNSISLKFLKGEGELNNLELNEAVLSDLLEFPPWLQLTKVTCNKISAKVYQFSLSSCWVNRKKIQVIPKVQNYELINLPSLVIISNNKF